MSHPTPMSKKELELRLKELEHEYALARAGLTMGIWGAGGVMLSGLATMILALIPIIVVGKMFLSGTHLVIIFFILAAAVVIFFSFVFGRTAKIRAEISETKKLLELSSGDKVR
jgi:nitrate/nitrite transporter NarK